MPAGIARAVYSDGIVPIDQEPAVIRQLAEDFEAIARTLMIICNRMGDDPSYRTGATNLTVGRQAPEWDMVISWAVERHQPEGPAQTAAETGP